MSTTPQTNTTLADIAEVIRDHASFALCGHVNPDGDCLGSQLALAHVLKAMGKDARCLKAKDDPIDHALNFLPGASDLVPASRYEESPEVFIAVDVPTTERLGNGAAVQQRAQVTITIDHHACDATMSQLNYVDPDSASTTLLVWELISLLTDDVPRESAECCYTGLMTDTGRFQFQNADERAFRLAGEMVAAGANPSTCAIRVYQARTLASLKLEQAMLQHMTLAPSGLWALSYVTSEDFDATGAVKSDAESLIDTLRSLDGVRVVAILRDQGTGIRGSLRAKDEILDVAEVARTFGGGGHKAAAGFTYQGTLEAAIEEIGRALDGLVAEKDA